MSQGVKIAPSILSADFGNLEAEIAQVDPALVHYLHLDVMDGRFVPNITIGPVVVKAISERTNIPLDVHLMIEEPHHHVEAFAKAGAHIITIHAEATPHLQGVLRRIRDLGCRAGVSLNPATPLNVIENVLPDLDLVLLMTVNPGFGGQKFIPQMIGKIQEAAEILSGYPIELEVDGGVKISNAPDIVKAGAQILVSGSEIFGAPSYNHQIRSLIEAVDPHDSRL